MKDKKNNIDKESYSFGILVIMVTLVWALSGIAIYNMVPNWPDRGTFGDMFGAINALFSGLAFVGLIYTILMQRKEIELNRMEIKMNRKELKKATTAQVLSQEAMKEQVLQTHLTAKINAMSTVINYYNTQISNPQNKQDLIENAKQKRRNLIRQMDELIEGLEDSNVD